MTSKESASLADRDWLQCRNCDSWESFVFHNPSSIYCDECGKKVGSTSHPVESDAVAFDRDKSMIIHGDSRRDLAEVHWDPEKVRGKEDE